MSYNFYLYSMDKTTYENIKDMSYEQLESAYKDEDEYFYLTEIPQKMLYNFGDMDACDCNSIYSKGTQLFSNSNTMKDLEHYKPFVLNRDAIIEAINIYKDKIIKTLNKLLIDDNSYKKGSKSYKMEKYIKDTINLWENDCILDLGEKSQTITSSGYYEHEIFELVRLLKTIDWEEEVILFYGH